MEAYKSYFEKLVYPVGSKEPKEQYVQEEL